MKKLSYSLLVLLLAIAVGCSSSNPLADEAQSKIKDQKYDAALASAEKAIDTNPGSPLGYYYKGVALGEIAGAKDDPANRTDSYKEMKSAFATAQQIADTSGNKPGELENMDAVQVSLWQNEHNRAVQLATDDSLKQAVDNPLSKASSHLKNATIIEPDSALSWNVLAQVSAMNESYEDAGNAKEHYIDLIEDTAQDTTLEANDYLQVASFYFQADNNDKVISALEDGTEQFPENQELVSNLADAYQRSGNSEKAISIVRDLVKENPEDPQFHLVLGTQIYQQALVLNDTLSANNDKLFDLNRSLKSADEDQKASIKSQIDELKQENERLEPKVKELSGEAEKELKKVLQYRSDEDKAYNTLGIIYQNQAKAAFDKRNQTKDNEEAQKWDDKGKDLLKKAMENYKRATEIKPEKKDYWESLYSIYVALGKDAKAAEAKKKAGL